MTQVIQEKLGSTAGGSWWIEPATIPPQPSSVPCFAALEGRYRDGLETKLPVDVDGRARHEPDQTSIPTQIELPLERLH